MRVAITDVAYCLPERVLTNEDLRRENPSWNMRLLEERTGVRQRHVARPDETALDLAVGACESLLATTAVARNEVDGVIFCTQSPDYIFPPNACILQGKLDLPDRALAFDYNLGCSGFIYGLAVARGLIVSGMARQILLVTADTYTKYINRQDRSARALFGDGAAVTVVGASEGPRRIVDIECATYGKDYDKFMIPAGGCRMRPSADTAVEKRDLFGNVRSLDNIHMHGRDVLEFITSKTPAQIEALLQRNGLTKLDVDVFVFHQSSRLSIDQLGRIMDIDPKKVFVNLDQVGNTVSASIPIALKDALEQGVVRSGHRVVLCGFGVGLSLGSALVEA
jgi:3-oxoacyl-[acyl-carrier-protein] synthase-3